MLRELVCPKCHTEFEDNGKDYPHGVLCPACPYTVKGVIYPRRVRMCDPETMMELLARTLKVLIKGSSLSEEDRVFVGAVLKIKAAYDKEVEEGIKSREQREPQESMWD